MCMRSVMINHRQSYDLRICADYVLISESSWYTRGGVGTIQPVTGSPVILVSPIPNVFFRIGLTFKGHDSYKTLKLDYISCLNLSCLWFVDTHDDTNCLASVI